MDEANLFYFTRRLNEERLAAASASDPRAAASHADLAARYEAVVRAYAGGHATDAGR